VPQVDVTLETALPPEKVREALLDFSERRPEIWPGITPSLYEVYSVGETTAEIKEGTKLPVGAFWARERYDWSDPSTIRWTVQESNFCTPGSYVSAKLSPREGGGTRVDLHWERTGTTLLGRMIGRMIVLSKGKPIAASFEKALKNLQVGSPAS
jgi:Polyketide cyclase / dehydrase and lipid transport